MKNGVPYIRNSGTSHHWDEQPHLEDPRGCGTAHYKYSFWEDMDSRNEERLNTIRATLESIRRDGVSAELVHVLIQKWRPERFEDGYMYDNPMDIKWEIVELGLGRIKPHGTVEFNTTSYKLWGEECKRISARVLKDCTWFDDDEWNPSLDTDEPYISSDEYYSTTHDNTT